MLQISNLFIYPIKSLGGIELQKAKLTDRGLEHDRRWLLVDDNNKFLTQRTFPEMSLLKTSIRENKLIVFIKDSEEDSLTLDLVPISGEKIQVDIWDDSCEAHQIDQKADKWFSQKLNRNVKLVYMPDSSRRQVDSAYALQNDITSFSDGYPILMIGQSSLDDLNIRLDEPVPMNRFRPNIVFTGGFPYQEDELKHFKINELAFFGVKPCGRCVMTTIDQDTAIVSKEPLKTLSTYRGSNNKVNFGQNILHTGFGSIQVGDEIQPIGAL
ncbi:MAG: MOSC domain-containing protein [Chitinophagaceae bacterium]